MEAKSPVEFTTKLRRKIKIIMDQQPNFRKRVREIATAIPSSTPLAPRTDVGPSGSCGGGEGGVSEVVAAASGNSSAVATDAFLPVPAGEGGESGGSCS